MNWMTRMTAWAKSHVLAVDTACTLLIGVILLLITTNTGSIPGVFFSCPPAVRVFWQIAMLIPMALRRWKPEPSAWAITAITTGQLILGPALVPADLFALTVLYAVIVYGNPKRSRLFACLALALGIMASLALAASSSLGPVFGFALSPYRVSLCQGNDPHTCSQNFLASFAGSLIITILCIITVIFFAYWQRARNTTITALRERNTALQAGEEERRRIAALAERARIARDMHDIVAHTLSIIIVQSDGGRYAGASNPDIAKHTMHTIKQESERAMQDMRHLLGVFGEPDHADYRQVSTLIDEARHTGGDIRLAYRVHGQPHPAWLSETASTAMYRMVQEALSNIRKYAGPDVHVNIDEIWDTQKLTVSVTDDGRGASAAIDGHKPGYGLQGMRERIAMASGSVQAGPRLSGGFEVTASVPYRDVPGYGGPGALAARAAAAATPTARPANRAAVIHDSDTVDGGSHHERHQVTRPPSAVPTRDLKAARPAAASWISRARRHYVSNRQATPVMSDGTRHGANTVERMSGWWEHHYLFSDILSGILIAIMFSYSGVNVGNNLQFVLAGRQTDAIDQTVIWIVTIMVMLPWMFRRRFPRASAAVAVIFALIQIMVMPCILFVNIMTLGVLSAVILYGNERTVRGAIAAAGLITCACAASVLAGTMGYRCLLAMLADIPRLARPNGTMLVETALAFVVIAALCLITIVSALWKRSSGNDALVQQAREQALREEAHRQQILAANVERDRISANIQSEVTQTLQSVIARTDAGLAMFEQAEREGSEPDADAVRDAFKQIGEQGREALARMRELLGVLRKTGFSDEDHDRSEDIAPLAPVAPGAVSDALSAAETAATGTTAATAESAG